MRAGGRCQQTFCSIIMQVKTRPLWSIVSGSCIRSQLKLITLFSVCNLKIADVLGDFSGGEGRRWERKRGRSPSSSASWIPSHWCQWLYVTGADSGRERASLRFNPDPFIGHLRLIPHPVPGQWKRLIIRPLMSLSSSPLPRTAVLGWAHADRRRREADNTKANNYVCCVNQHMNLYVLFGNIRCIHSQNIDRPPTLNAFSALICSVLLAYY